VEGRKKTLENRQSDDVLFERVVFLGTSSAVPCPGRRNMSSLVTVFSNGSTVMVDCGEGTQHQLKVCTLAKASRLDLICITHLHGDHCLGLFGLLLTSGSDGRTDPVVLVGPEGLKQMLDSVFSLSAPPEYPLHFIEIPNAMHRQCLESGQPYKLKELLPPQLQFLGNLSAVPLIHGMTTWGYVIEESGKEGKLDVRKALALGVPSGPKLGLLKKGQNVVLDDGTTVSSSDCLGERQPGRKICVLQDSSDSTAACRMEPLQNVDLFIHEATFEHAMEEEAIEKGHSTGVMAAKFANMCNAKRVALTHFSARYNPSTKLFLKEQRKLEEMRGNLGCCADGESSEPSGGELACEPADPAETVVAAEAREVFTGPHGVHAAQDWMVFQGPTFAPVMTEHDTNPAKKVAKGIAEVRRKPLLAVSRNPFYPAAGFLE